MTNASASSAASARSAAKIGLTVGEADAIFLLTVFAANEANDGPALFYEYAEIWRELAREMDAPESTTEEATC